MNTRICLTLLATTAVACRSGAGDEPPTHAAPSVARSAPVRGEVFSAPFVFSIGGMRKVNGAL